MKITYGKRNPLGTGVKISLTGNEVALAIDSWLMANDVRIFGPRSILINGEIGPCGFVYVDPLGFVISHGEEFSGRGPEERVASKVDVYNKMQQLSEVKL